MIEPRIAPAWVASFRQWFGVTPSEARVLLALYQAQGRILSGYNLSLLAGVTEYSVPTHVHRLRTAMRPEALDQERGQGYRLSQIGQGECRTAIAQMIHELEMDV